MNEITIPCSNCKQPIAESKHMLHETYCQRNNIKCLKCGLFYDKNDPDSHEEEYSSIIYIIQQYHKKEKCQYCFLESEDLKKHKCNKKPKQCMHCDLYFPSDQLFQHENQCGSRTQKCDICNSYVIMREYQHHVMTCKPKPKVEPPQFQTKPSNQEIVDKPIYNKPQIDDKIDQQKFSNKKETTLQQNPQSQSYQKQQVQQQQQQQVKPAGSGYKYQSAVSESKNQYQINNEDKNRQKEAIRPPSSNNQIGSRTQKQPINQGTEQKQQISSTTYNQRQQNSSQKEDKTQFDNQYEKQQYINKQSQQFQPQTQQQYSKFVFNIIKFRMIGFSIIQLQQQKQLAPSQKSLESYKNSYNNKPQQQFQYNRPDLKRPDTAIAREIQKQMELEEEFGISSEEYLQQQEFNQMSLNEQQEKVPQIKKAAPPPPPQPVVPTRVPQNFDNQEFDFGDISEEEKLIQQQIMESLQHNQKKR